jgi:cytochrome P450 family 4
MFLTTGEDLTAAILEITKGFDFLYICSITHILIFTTGSRWRNRRRLLTPAFHFQILNSFVDVFNEKSADCAREFTKAIEAHGDENEIDIFPMMTQCALDIICGNYKDNYFFTFKIVLYCSNSIKSNKL